MMLSENVQRLLRIEAKVDAILQHLNVQFDPKPAIRKLAKNRDKIAAIRLHRSCYGSSLAAAKKEVEGLATS